MLPPSRGTEYPIFSSPDRSTPSRERAGGCACAGRRRRACGRRRPRRAARAPASRRRHGQPALGGTPALARAEPLPASSPRVLRASSPSSRPRRSARWRCGGPCARCRAAPPCSARPEPSPRCSRCAACARPSRACAQRSRRATSTAARVARGARPREPRHLATRRERALGSRHPVAGGEPQRLGGRAPAGLRRRRSARRRGLPRAQHRRRDVGLSHAPSCCTAAGPRRAATISRTSCPPASRRS